ncbi:MAG TPA: hypothetical protein VIQ29_03250 [Ancylobacter sp.]
MRVNHPFFRRWMIRWPVQHAVAGWTVWGGGQNLTLATWSFPPRPDQPEIYQQLHKPLHGLTSSSFVLSPPGDQGHTRQAVNVSNVRCETVFLVPPRIGSFYVLPINVLKAKQYFGRLDE